MQLDVTTTGDGPKTVALIHGIAANAAQWGALADRLAETGDYTVLAPDLRGHGETGRTTSYRISEFVDDLVQTLPQGLHSAVGHSLGGALLFRAVPRLRPAHAIYLDPGFKLGLPAEGWKARAFWTIAPLSVPLAMLRSRASGASAGGEERYAEGSKALVAAAQRQFDGRMTIEIFRQLTFDPAVSAAPVVPSTVVLSSEAPAVVPDPLPAELERLGWDVRRAPSVGHAFWLHDLDATFDAVRDVI